MSASSLAPTLRLAAVVLIYVVVVLILLVRKTSRDAQTAISAAVDRRQSLLPIPLSPSTENNPNSAQASAEQRLLWNALQLVVPAKRAWANPWRRVPKRNTLAAWQLLHQFDALHDPGDSGAPFLLASEIDRASKKTSSTLLFTKAQSLTDVPPANTADENLKKQKAEQKAVLSQLRKVNDDRRDTIAAQQVDLARRGMFLLVLGGAAVIFVGHFLGHHLLLAVGAGAGILSRMSSRSNETKRASNDYGVAWTKIILAPLVGALGALFGLFLIGGIGNAGFFGPSICPLITPVALDLGTNPATTTTTTVATVTTTTVAAIPPKAPPLQTSAQHSSEQRSPVQQSADQGTSVQQSPGQSPVATTTSIPGDIAASRLPPPLPGGADEINALAVTPTITTDQTPTDSTTPETQSPNDSATPTAPAPPSTTGPLATNPTTPTAQTTAVATIPLVFTPAQPCPVAAVTPANPANPGAPIPAPVKQDRENTTTIALAIVLGFSERLFARMIGHSENYITGQLNGNDKEK